MNQLERFEKDIFQVILDFDKMYMSECCSTPIDIIPVEILLMY